MDELLASVPAERRSVLELEPLTEQESAGLIAAACAVDDVSIGDAAGHPGSSGRQPIFP